MNARKFLKTVPMKVYALLTALVILSFFSNDFGLVDIQKTAIILAAGIDRTEDGQFSLTSQIAVPKGSDRAMGGTTTVDIHTVGKTVSDCVSLTFAETGWVPKLVFCNLIVLGEDAAKEDTLSFLDYFLRNEYMNDSCLLTVCEGKAQDLITSESATDDSSSMAIVKLFSDAAEKSGQVVPNTLKDFAIGCFGKSRSGYLPYIRAQTQRGADGTPSHAANGGDEEEEEQKVYSAEQTAIFSEGRMVGLLPREQTLAYSLLKGKVEAGTFNAEDGGKPVTLAILQNGGGVSLDMKGAPKVRVSIDVVVRFCCRGNSAPMEEISSDTVPEDVLKSAKELLTGHVRGLWKTCTEAGCDLLNLKRDLFRSSKQTYEAWKDYLPAAAEIVIEAEVKSTK